MIDYHVHTHHSIDAEGTVREYCKQAIKTGLKEICFTNHCELDPFRNDSLIRFTDHKQPLTREALLRLQDEIFREREFFRRSSLKVRFGLEIGYYDGIEPYLKKLLEDINFDFLLGSIHCLDHICIDSSKESSEYFIKHSASELLHNYFLAIEKLINSQLFDSIGHLDVYKKYGFGFYKEEINTVPEEIIRKIFRMMKEKKIAFEINTAGLRRINQFYPSPSIMEYAQEQGLELITVGSDAHRVEDLGKGIKQSFEYAKSFGFDAVYGFEKRKATKIKI
ncbi:histidinol-phosphatase [candidate division WOR-3 bacterium]|nr:histidinol-phosphatase [candidate division WOR-3 bacterium]